MNSSEGGTGTRESVLAAAGEAFPGRPMVEIMRVLDLYGTESHEKERERVQLAILKLSDGDEQSIFHYVEAAKTDYRDVLYWAGAAESPGSGGQDSIESPSGLDPMTPANARAVLEHRVRQAGVSVGDLTLAQGLRVMMEFYRDVRAEGCVVGNEGDMLLFESAITNSGGGFILRCGFARQFTMGEAEDQDPEISQVLLTFDFPIALAPESPLSDSYWCDAPDSLAEFKAVVEATAGFRAARELRPSQVALVIDQT
jgi:hypothetical protein